MKKAGGDDPAGTDRQEKSRLAEEAPTAGVVAGSKPGGAGPSGAPDTLTTGSETDTAALRPERERVGHYRLIQRIGEGGMGAVYLAVRDDDQYRKRAAVKLLRKGMETEELLGRFRRERQILASLDHDNIARLLDGGATEDGLPYLVMEYVEGQPVDQYCDTHRLSIRERLELFRAVCSAVHFAHQNLVVHRDLKPSNILVTPKGIPKLLDFGIAKLLNPDLSSPAIVATQVEQRVMTPQYASPEQIRGEPVTTAADVYSLGVLLYELLTGHRPYRLATRSLTEIARAVCELEPTRPSTVVQQEEEAPEGHGSARWLTPASVSETREGSPERLRRRLAGDLDTIVLMAMRKEPQRRYASAEQLSEDIRRHLEGRPVVARKDTLGYRAERFVARNRAGVAAAALVVLALLGGIAATAWQARAARAERARAERALGDVRRLANAFIFDFHDAIEKLPGATPAREMVVKRALEYLDRLAQDAPGDPALQLELAAAYARVGGIQWYRAWAHLGQTQGALESQRKALAIREAVVGADPANPAAREALAASHHLVGDVLEGMGKLEEALGHHRRSLALREELLATDPRNVALRKNLAITHDRIGDILVSRGDRAGALESYRKMQEITESLAGERPVDLDARYWVGVSYENLGRLRAADGDAAGALELYRRQLEIFRGIVRSEPANAQVRRDLGVAYHSVGGRLGARGDWEGALASYRQALALREELAAADPANQGARQDLSYTLDNVAAALVALGRTAEARGYAGRSLELYKEQAQRTEATADDANSYAWQLLTVTPPELRDPRAALPYAKRAVEATLGKNANMLDTLALAHHLNGDQEAAIATEQRALDLLPAGAPQRRDFEVALARFKAGRRGRSR